MTITPDTDPRQSLDRQTRRFKAAWPALAWTTDQQAEWRKAFTQLTPTEAEHATDWAIQDHPGKYPPSVADYLGHARSTRRDAELATKAQAAATRSASHHQDLEHVLVKGQFCPTCSGRVWLTPHRPGRDEYVIHCPPCNTTLTQSTGLDRQRTHVIPGDQARELQLDRTVYAGRDWQPVPRATLTTHAEAA